MAWRACTWPKVRVPSRGGACSLRSTPREIPGKNFFSSPTEISEPPRKFPGGGAARPELRGGCGPGLGARPVCSREAGGRLRKFPRNLEKIQLELFRFRSRGTSLCPVCNTPNLCPGDLTCASPRSRSDLAPLLTNSSMISSLPPLLAQIKQLAVETDYFYGSPALVMALLFVKPDGGFGDQPKWQLCLAGVVVMMRACRPHLNSSFVSFATSTVVCASTGGLPLHGQAALPRDGA